jgi:hypothetical protein
VNLEASSSSPGQLFALARGQPETHLRPGWSFRKNYADIRKNWKSNWNDRVTCTLVKCDTVILLAVASEVPVAWTIVLTIPRAMKHMLSILAPY